MRSWMIKDGRDGKLASLGTWSSKTRALEDIAAWKVRQERGGRPDITRDMLDNMVPFCCCASCKAGLTCYESSVPVSLADGRTSDHVLYGDMLEIVNKDPAERDRLLTLLTERQPLHLDGIDFYPTTLNGMTCCDP